MSQSTVGRKLLPVRIFAKIAIRRAFRDKTALFFIFLFPLIFLFVFGGIFGKHNDVSFRVAFINQSDSSFAKQFTEEAKQQKVLKIDKDSDTLAKAKEKMNRGQLDAAIILPPDFGKPSGNLCGSPYCMRPQGQAQVIYTQNNEQAGQTLTSILQEEFKGINSKFVDTNVPFTVVGKQTNDKTLSQFDYTFAGLVGFSIIGLGIFGPVNVFPELKKQGVLRRLQTTPLRVWQYFVANAVSQSIIGLISIASMFVISIAVFHLKVVGNPLELAAYIVLSIVMILGIGLALGGWAKNAQQAAPLANIVVFPMFFLSGTFFPRFLMPEWLQKVSNFLPLTPVIDGIRLIATEGKHFTALGPQLGLIAAWLIVVYVIAFRVFRWE